MTPEILSRCMDAAMVRRNDLCLPGRLAPNLNQLQLEMMIAAFVAHPIYVEEFDGWTKKYRGALLHECVNIALATRDAMVAGSKLVDFASKTVRELQEEILRPAIEHFETEVQRHTGEA